MSSAKAVDHWSAGDYKAAANFVHKLTTKVVRNLDPQPGEKILDVGCGDGALTVQIADAVAAGGAGGAVHGLDASGNFIEYAQATYGRGRADLTFELQDCSRLDESWAAAHEGRYDKVFSNAALHWILRAPERRAGTMRAMLRVLRPGGTLVFEMGGAGNVSEMNAAFVAAMIQEAEATAAAAADGSGRSDDGGAAAAAAIAAAAHEACPWFFPSDVLISSMLAEAGFSVDAAELEYRPTRLEAGPGGGVEGWARLMGAEFLARVPEPRREAVLQRVVAIARPICTRPEPEGGEWLGYVRCRAIAHKPT